MRRAVLAVVAVLAAAPAAADARGEVDVMVVGQDRVLVPAKQVELEPRAVGIRGRRCAIGRATPLSALAGTGVRLGLVDYGACSRRARDAGGLYVRSIAGQRAGGRRGWVYKVGRRAGNTAAADPSGPFGTGRMLRPGQQVLWFWCVLDRRGGCQRTLETAAPATAAPGAAVAVTVRGYDDRGRGVPVAGATVTLGGATAVTGPDGTATLSAPAAPGRHALEASKPGLVAAFPRTVEVA